MEVFSDWKFWFAIVHLSITVGGFCLLKFNDFKHLEKDVGEIKSNNSKTNEKIDELKEDVAYIKGTRDSESKVLKLLENSLKKS